MLLHLWNIEHWQLRSYRLPSERGDRSGFARTVWPISYWKGTPPKTWIPKIAIFERRYILETIIFGIYVNFFAGVVWCSTILHPVFWFHLHSLLQEMLTFHIRYRWHLMAIYVHQYIQFRWAELNHWVFKTQWSCHFVPPKSWNRWELRWRPSEVRSASHQNIVGDAVGWWHGDMFV